MTIWKRRAKSCAKHSRVLRRRKVNDTMTTHEVFQSREGCPQRAERRSYVNRWSASWSRRGEDTAPCLHRHHYMALTLSSALLAITLLPIRAADVQGITESFHEVTLSSAVAGLINTEKSQEGDFVKEGDAVVELDK